MRLTRHAPPPPDAPPEAPEPHPLPTQAHPPTTGREAEVNTCLQDEEQRNARFFDEEALKLDRWSDDLKQGLERETMELDKQTREARKESSLAATLQDKLAAQKKLRALEGERKRKELFEPQDAIDAQRDTPIAKLESQMRQELAQEALFHMHWRIL